MSTDDANAGHIKARFIATHLNRTGLALRDVEDDEAMIDGVFQGIQEPCSGSGIARTKGLQNQSLKARSLQGMAHEVLGDAWEELEDAHMTVHLGMHLEFLEVGLQDALLIIFYMYAHVGEVGIVRRDEGVEVFGKINNDLEAFMTEKGYGSIEEMVGIAHD